MIALIDYGMGNLLSVYKAFQFCGADVEIVADPDSILNADAVILPGVGNFGDGMKHLIEKKLDAVILHAIKQNKPFLGICLGMQLLMDFSEEAPGVSGLGVFKGGVHKFDSTGLKVPHMGWNNINVTNNDNKIFKNIEKDSFFYFVHSFYVICENRQIIAAECTYGQTFAAALSENNVHATQFHPEKSQDKGLQIIKNFIATIKK
jgi:glutamine amidotransferase